MQVREVEKSQGVPSASWRPRRDNGAVGVQVQRPGIRRTDDVGSSLSPKVGENQCPSSKTVRQREQILPSSVFCSIQVSKDWRPTHTRQGPSALLSLLIPMLISSGSTLTDTPRIMLNQISGCPVAKSSQHIKLTTIVA